MNLHNLKKRTSASFTVRLPAEPIMAALLDDAILAAVLRPDPSWEINHTLTKPNHVDWECFDGEGKHLAAGTVSLRPAPGDEGHEVRVDAGLDTWHGKDSEGSVARNTPGTFAFHVHEALRRFKALLETGEIPTIEGQPTGKKGKKL